MRYFDAELRHELKYYISGGEYRALRARLLPVLRLDGNSRDANGYHIRSLYYDDMYDAAMSDKLTGQQRRDKYRVRIYNISGRRIMMERKSKYGSFISKTSAPITKDMLGAMSKGDYGPLLNTAEPLLREVFVKRSTVLLRPSVIVDYVREAYVYGPGNVRITFDKDVRAGIAGYDILSAELPASPVVERGRMVLEIKFDDYLPEVVRRLVRPITADICAISKYVMCRRRLTEIKTNARRVVRAVNG